MSAEQTSEEDDLTFAFPGDSHSLVDDAIGAFEALETRNARVMGIVAADLNVGATDVRALLFIAQNAPVTPKTTANHLGLTTGATTGLTDRMARVGLIHRSPHPTDRRSLLLELAPDGREAVLRVQDFYRRAFRSALKDHELIAASETFRNIARSLLETAESDSAIAKKSNL